MQHPRGSGVNTKLRARRARRSSSLPGCLATSGSRWPRTYTSSFSSLRAQNSSCSTRRRPIPAVYRCDLDLGSCSATTSPERRRSGLSPAWQQINCGRHRAGHRVDVHLEGPNHAGLGRRRPPQDRATDQPDGGEEEARGQGQGRCPRRIIAPYASHYFAVPPACFAFLVWRFCLRVFAGAFFLLLLPPCPWWPLRAHPPARLLTH
jgi:hypothetical protein